jgi:hypothetical protein
MSLPPYYYSIISNSAQRALEKFKTNDYSEIYVSFDEYEGEMLISLNPYLYSDFLSYYYIETLKYLLNCLEKKSNASYINKHNFITMQNIFEKITTSPGSEDNDILAINLAPLMRELFAYIPFM